MEFPKKSESDEQSKMDDKKPNEETPERLATNQAFNNIDDIFLFPSFPASREGFANICLKLGAKLEQHGRSGFKNRNLFFVVVGSEASASNIDSANQLIARAEEIFLREKKDKIFEEFSSHSYDQGLSGYLITGGKKESLNNYEILQVAPDLLHITDLKWSNSADARRGMTHMYRSFYIDKSKVDKNNLTLKIRERDKSIFIGKGGMTLENLRLRLGVEKVNIQNPDYSSEVLSDFLDYITNENIIHNLPEKFQIWKKICCSNKESVNTYDKIRIRSGGKLPNIESNFLNEHYKEQLGSKKVVSLDQLCILIKQNKLPYLDVSKELLFDKEKIEIDNPAEMEQDGLRFNIKYDSNFRKTTENLEGESKSEEFFLVSTSIDEKYLEHESLANGLNLPNGRPVTLEINIVLPPYKEGHQITGKNTAELKEKIQNLIIDEFLEKTNKYLSLRRNNTDFVQYQISRSQNYYTSEFYKVIQDVAPQVPKNGLTKHNLRNEIEIAENKIDSDLKAISDPVNLIFKQHASLGDDVALFFNELLPEERKFLTHEEKSIQNALSIIPDLLLEAKEIEAKKLIEKNIEYFITLKAQKSDIVRNNIKNFENIKSKFPNFIKGYYEEDIDKMILAIEELEYAEKKLSKMNAKEMEYYRREFSVGEKRRARAMDDILKGFSKNTYSKLLLPDLAGNNRGPYNELRGYLFYDMFDYDMNLDKSEKEDSSDPEITIDLNEGGNNLNEVREKFEIAEGMAKALLKGALLNSLNSALENETDPHVIKNLRVEINKIKKG